MQINEVHQDIASQKPETIQTATPADRSSLRQRWRSGAWRPAKVTPDDVQASMSAWRSRHRAVAGRRSRWVLALLVVAALAGLAGLESSWSSSFVARSAANDHTISVLRTRVNRPVVKPDWRARAKVLRASVVSARRVAKQVAAGQQRYAVLMHRATTGHRDGPAAVVVHRSDLAGSWTKDSLIVPDGQVGDTRTGVSFGRAQMDPRWPWYVRYDGLTASPSSKTSWQVVSVWPSGASDTVMRVTWRCRQMDGAILAWATATFHAGSGKFSDLSVTVTAAGARHGQNAAGRHTSPTRAKPKTGRHHANKKHGKAKWKRAGHNGSDRGTEHGR